ncbi:MAG: GNAT family N-acetyltransferase [Gammaproteobacteria bacterium]|nr:GNAT family N-acetyltransferase [Gammaproteobacteria bacterium]
MEISVLRTDDAFLALKPQWKALIDKVPSASVFLSWEWQYLWWQHYQGNSSLFLLVCKENEQLRGIAPFYIDYRKPLHLFSQRVVRFIGTGGDTSPDYLDVISPSEYSAECCASILTFLFDHASEWDSLAFNDMENNSLFLNKILSKIALQPSLRIQRKDSNIYYNKLPSTWDEYRASLSKNRRGQINHRRNALKKAGELEFGYCHNSDEFDTAFEQLIALHTARWRQKNHNHSFQSKQYIHFHRAVIQQLSDINAVQLTYLKLNDQYIAVQYWYLWNESMYFFQSGFSPLYQRFSPGLVLMAYSIEFAIEKGMREIDMLKGDHEYKRSFAKELRPIVSFECAQPSFLADLKRVKNQMRLLLAK